MSKQAGKRTKGDKNEKSKVSERMCMCVCEREMERMREREI